MNKYKKYVNQTAFSFLAVMLGYLLFGLFGISQEIFKWIWNFGILIIFILNLRNYNLKYIMDFKGYVLTILFILWLFFGFIRGAFIAEGYWTWKFVISNLYITAFYSVIFLSTNIYVVQKYFSLYFALFIPMVLISFSFDGTPLSLNYVPYSVLSIFFAVIPKKQRLFLIAILILYILFNFQRNDFVKMFATFLIGITIHFFPFFFKLNVKFIYRMLMFIIFFLIGLGISGTFNIFKLEDYIKGNYEVETTQNGVKELDDLKADTRTFIYESVTKTMNKNEAWLFGRGTALGDEFSSFDNNFKVSFKGRYGNEVGILDILLWYGLVGVMLYFLIYLRASYIAVFESKNIYAKGVGIYVLFLFSWSFVWEKPLFETFFMIDLLILGLCFSNKFKSMTDNEVKIWVYGIFNN